MIKRCITWLSLVLVALWMRATPVQGATTTTAIFIQGADEVRTYTSSPPLDETSPFDHEPGFTIRGANENNYRKMAPICGDMALLIDQVPFRIILIRADKNHVVRIQIPQELLVHLATTQTGGITSATHLGGENENAQPASPPLAVSVRY